MTGRSEAPRRGSWDVNGYGGRGEDGPVVAVQGVEVDVLHRERMLVGAVELAASLVCIPVNSATRSG